MAKHGKHSFKMGGSKYIIHILLFFVLGYVAYWLFNRLREGFNVIYTTGNVWPSNNTTSTCLGNCFKNYSNDGKCKVACVTNALGATKCHTSFVSSGSESDYLKCLNTLNSNDSTNVSKWSVK